MGLRKRFGEEAGVINEPAVDVAEIEATVGAVAQVDRSAPFVARNDKVSFVPDSLRPEAGPVFDQAGPGDELGGGFADKEIPLQIGDGIPPVNGESAGGGVSAGVGYGSGVAQL